MTDNMTNAKAGVDYDLIDRYKVSAQKVAATTDSYIKRFGISVVPWTRGESVMLIDMPWGYMAFLVEGLGTKNLVADAMSALAWQLESVTGTSYYDVVGQCNVAMKVNDMVTLGALPVMVGQYLAVGESEWFKDERRQDDLIEGTRRACELAGCSMGPGDTPSLADIIMPGASSLSGAAVGWLARKEQVFSPSKIRHGDAIVIIESSGIHANGLSMARKIAKKLPDGYLTRLPDGRTFGEALLIPTHIYAPLIQACLLQEIPIHYTVNITGHGWRKLMRAMLPFTYVINCLPEWQPIFGFLQEHGPVDDQEAYASFNMGAGFALYVDPRDVSLVLRAARALNFVAFPAGHIEKSDVKMVDIKPNGVKYDGSTLSIR